MLLLTTTSDKLQIKTSQAVNTDYFVSWNDRGIGGVLNRNRGTITTAATTDVVSSPATDNIRVVQILSVRNRHASTAQEVTVIHHDGTTAVEIYSALLYPGDTLVYDMRFGFEVIQRVTASNQTYQPVVNQAMSVVLASDVVNNNATANTIASVTGLSFPVLAGLVYWFRFTIDYTAQATTTGSRWSVSGPGSPTRLSYCSQYSLSATGRSFNEGLSAYDMPASCNASSAATGANRAIIEGHIKPSADGDVIARFASEIANSAITAKAGSVCEWMNVL